MATVTHAISQHDVVILRKPVGSCPAGTSGAVVSVYDDSVLVEVADDDGKTLDAIQVPATGRGVKRS